MRPPLIFVLASCAIGVFARNARSATGPVDAVEFGRWLDRFFTPYVKQSAEPSAAFVMVKDGRVFLQRGYGFADFHKKTPVVPDTTLFQAASVSKLITATAAMQLVAAGKLRLDTDVNSYLKNFQIERTRDRPITLADLLTHTSGIDDSFILGSVDRPSDLRPLGDFFARHPPRPPTRRDDRVLKLGDVARRASRGDCVGPLVLRLCGAQYFSSARHGALDVS